MVIAPLGCRMLPLLRMFHDSSEDDGVPMTLHDGLDSPPELQAAFPTVDDFRERLLESELLNGQGCAYAVFAAEPRVMPLNEARPQKSSSHTASPSCFPQGCRDLRGSSSPLM